MRGALKCSGKSCLTEEMAPALVLSFTGEKQMVCEGLPLRRQNHNSKSRGQEFIFMVSKAYFKDVMCIPGCPG